MTKNVRLLPKISIVIPSYNKVSFIEDTLQSIVDQKYPNLEVIIQDGGSTDGTLEVIKKYASKYPDVFNFVSKRDKGQVDAINKGLRKATGEIVSYINADDIYKQGAFLAVGRYFQKTPGVLWVTGYGDIIDGEGKVISSWVSKYKNKLLVTSDYRLLLMVNYVSQPATFLSRKAYRKYGPFTGTKNYVMEYDLWLKLGKVQMPGVIKRVLASFRLAEGSISTTAFKKLLELDQKISGQYTNNRLILSLHRLHNLARSLLVKAL